MTEFAVLCTGPSLSQAIADSVRHLRVIAVNGAYVLAPWAEALAANDVRWWSRYPEAKRFAGRKFSASRIRGVEQMTSVSTSLCSGVLGLEAAKRMGATRIYLFGVDGRGSHFFGTYTNGLTNSSPKQFAKHAAQFKHWGRVNRAVEVINATPGSALRCFPFGSIEEMHAQAA